MSNQQVSFVLLRAIHDAYNTFVGGLLTDCNFPDDAANSPVVIGDPIYGPKVPNFTEFMAPGIILLIIFFLAVALTGNHSCSK